MGNLLSLTATWEVDITQLETTDPVEGGPSGIDNIPHRQLASRTLWLKAQMEAVQAALASHGHAIADVTGLQAALNGKAASAHSHAVVDVTGLQAALDALSQALNGKAASAHGHSGADVTYADGSASYKLSVVSGVLTQTRL